MCSCLGLACMFGGIWIGDSLAASTLNSDHAVFVMRVFSVAIYAAFFVISVRVTAQDPVELHRFFSKAVTVGAVSFLVGMAIFLYENMQGGGVLDKGVLWFALFRTKVVGAPVSVGLVCVFAQMRANHVLHASTVGMLGAFLIYTIAHQTSLPWISPETESALTSVVLMFLACFFGAMGLSDKALGDMPYSGSDMLNFNVVKRPASQVVTSGLVCLLVFSAMMLGYLRSGYLSIDAHAQPISILVLPILIFVAVGCRQLRVEHVFYVAFMTATASILLLPFLSMISEEFPLVLRNVGTALFEVVVWVFVVWAARNCLEPLRTAAGTRFAVVVGHLLGTLAVVAGIAASDNPIDAAIISGMLVTFSYIMMLLIILKNPSMKPPLRVEDEYVYVSTAPKLIEQQEIEVAGADPENVEDVLEEENQAVDYETMYWSMPCELIAKTYRLTRRETEVLEQLAHGYSLASMADTMCISLNTMKMHMRNIYTKLDVHSRQDVIDMVDLVRAQQEKDRRDSANA
ncbi:response regulator containing a CheY-like receiver domain and an HTH DNA-binding domain [Slackia heliotrinireducens DSM 20476]|uniref:Response regulator containing a CheY-like receiver domain and an HTH DNA-binding domain n=1 Tax=Slackia heliotrinireducens (strain ATCC 29202 / DSM 20476 / NCTC 11029 / RHS 1) TaxID=471855 RepID=C7N3G5_SLAHD|nr:response regulator containing a CheY-like receiver domain and an HTH DNA-binding domain [Slackia heliotrinireducens DSM 20476]